MNKQNLDTCSDHIPKVDVLLLQERKAKGGSMTTAAGWAIFHARPREIGVAAVAVPAADMQRVLWLEAIGNHIGVVYQKESEAILIVSAYIPTRGRPLHAYEQALENIMVLMTKAPLTSHCAVAGDMNFAGGSWMQGESFGHNWHAGECINPRSNLIKNWAERMDMREVTTSATTMRPTWTRRGRNGQKNTQLDFGFLSDGLEGDCKHRREVQDPRADFDHPQLVLGIRSAECPDPPSTSGCRPTRSRPTKSTYIKAPRITMHKHWDVGAFSNNFDDLVTRAYTEDRDDLGHLNMIVVRAMREAAHHQRAPRAVTQREELRGLAEAVKVRNEELKRQERNAISREIAKIRRRARRQRALRSAVRPRRERGGGSAPDGRAGRPPACSAARDVRCAARIRRR